MQAARQSRPGGRPPGRRGPENAPIKPDWNAKKSLGIFPGSDYVPLTTSVQGCWPRRCYGWRPEFSKREPAPSERFQNAGPIERDGFRELRCFRPQSERKPDIAPERSREKPVLVLAGRMI